VEEVFNAKAQREDAKEGEEKNLGRWWRGYTVRLWP
jgi:hypothetical protein